MSLVTKESKDGEGVIVSLPDVKTRELVISELNDMLTRKDLYNKETWKENDFADNLKKLIDKKPSELTDRELAIRNKALLKEALSGYIEGVRWGGSTIIWDKHLPHPAFHGTPAEIVFLTNTDGECINKEDEVTSGLQEIVMLFPGYLTPVKDGPDFTPLLKTGKESGMVEWNSILPMAKFAAQLPPQMRRQAFQLQQMQDSYYKPEGKEFVLAARVKGKINKGKVNLIVVADIDMISSMFYEMRKQNKYNTEMSVNFSNVSFIHNCIDSLAGDVSFIKIRKKEHKLRTLKKIEDIRKKYTEQLHDERVEAEREAKDELKKARDRLEAKKKECRDRKDLDKRSKEIWFESVERIEENKYDLFAKNTNDDLKKKAEAAERENIKTIKGIEHKIKILAVLLPPIPAFLLALIVFIIRRLKERDSLYLDTK